MAAAVRAGAEQGAAVKVSSIDVATRPTSHLAQAIQCHCLVNLYVEDTNRHWSAPGGMTTNIDHNYCSLMLDVLQQMQVGTPSERSRLKPRPRWQPLALTAHSSADAGQRIDCRVLGARQSVEVLACGANTAVSESLFYHLKIGATGEQPRSVRVTKPVRR